MVSRCSFDMNSSNYVQVFCNIILLVIFILVLYYYIFYICKNKREEFEQTKTAGCITIEQNDMDVEMRQCSVYFVDKNKEDDCDRYLKYYNMTDIQLDIEITNAKNTNKHDFVKKLEEIKQHNSTHGNKCKLTYDNWKEIQKYHDKSNGEVYSYSKKNSTNSKEQVNYKLWNSCFSSTQNFNEIGFNEGVVPACTTKVSNIRDINSNDNNYVSIMFHEDATYDDIYKSICNSKTNNKELNIPTDKIFMKIECDYNSGKYLKIKNLEFVQYNNNSFKFDTIRNIYDTRIINNINSLFHITYDKLAKRVVISPKTMNKGSYLIHYNECKNIQDSSYQNVLFSFKDFNIENKQLDIDLTLVPKLLENLDKIKDEHDIFEIINTIGDVISYYENIKNGIKNDIFNLNKEIDSMITQNTQRNQPNNDFQEYIDKIFESRKTTDEQLYKYLDKINAVRNYISRESLKNTLDEGVVTLNNSECRQLASETNKIIMSEYNTTFKNLNIILEIISNKIKTSFSKGSYVNLSTYNTNIIPSQIQSIDHMTNLIQNTKPTNSVSNKLDNNTISRFNTTINQTANINCFAVELSTNILLTKGYYNFVLDIESDDAICVYLGYKDNQNKDKMIFRNVAYYLSSTSRNNSSLEYPIESVMSNNGDNFSLSGTSKRSNNYWNMFDSNKVTFWSSDENTYKSGKGNIENKANYKGEVIYIDIKNPSRLLDYSIKYMLYDNAPNKLRIYGTNDNKGLNDINHVSWKLVDDVDNASYISGRFEKHVYKVDENLVENKIMDDTTNMLAWYKFDKDTLDSSGKGKHLSLKNNPSQRHDSSTSKIGSSVNLDGDTYLQNSTSGSYFNPNNLSVSAWIYGGRKSSIHQAIASARSYHGAGGWMIYILPNTKQISVWYGSSNRWVGITTPNIDVLFQEIWTLVTVTIDNSQTCSIYVNSGLVASGRFGGNMRRIGNSLRIGGGANESPTPRYYLANGAKLEDFRIYNKILSKYEIETLYNNSSNVSKMRKYPPAALASYSNETDSTKSVTLSGQPYGNGKYELSWSSDYGPWKPPHWFDGKNPGGAGGHFINYNGPYNIEIAKSNRFLTDSNYMGDWVKIKMPTKIFLSYIKIYQRNGFENRAPIDYKVYGSNNGRTWTEIIHTANAKYENKVHTSEKTDINVNTNTDNFINSTRDMAAWYRFENNWNDSSQNNNNLTGKSGVVEIIGDRIVGNYSANFNGHFKMENSSIDLSNKSFSVCYWANRRTGGYTVVLGQGSVTSTRQALHLGWRGNNIMFGFYGDDCDSIKSDWNDLNEWHHYCFTYDHSSRIRRIYYDGIEVSTRGQKPNGSNNFNKRITIGRAGWGWHHNDFNGKLDDLRIYHNKVLVPDEINAIFQSTSKTNYINESFNEFAIAVKRIGTGHQSYIVNYDEIEFYGTEEKQEDIVEKYRYYAMVVNELKGNQTSCQINEMKLYFEAKNGLTTKFPIYIDGNYNNGYYAIYVTSLRNSTNKSKNYFNVKYTKQDSAENSISLFDNRSYIYKFSETLQNSQTFLSINDLLYVYNDLKQTNVFPNRENSQNGTIVDPGIRKLNSMFYISCPSLPKLPDLPSKEQFRLKFKNHDTPKNKKDSVKNLQNIYDVRNILDELSKLRNIQFDDFDCMFKVDINKNITSATNTEIYNKKLLISSKNNELDMNNKFINDLTKINQQVSEHIVEYDINSIISSFQKHNVLNENSKLFYKYIRSLFKNTKDEKYYMYIQLN